MSGAAAGAPARAITATDITGRAAMATTDPDTAITGRATATTAGLASPLAARASVSALDSERWSQRSHRKRPGCEAGTLAVLGGSVRGLQDSKSSRASMRRARDAAPAPNLAQARRKCVERGTDCFAAALNR
jgi:hypothetical protein